ncbi:MAG: HAD family hydrolase [Spirochaetales bacterium]|nr:HAD family hydrolase [Spirochaetales bacterium]
MKDIRACFFDLDGTLVRSDHTLSPAVIRAMARLEAEGIAPIIATGRSYEALLPIKEKLNLHSPVICYNGAMIVNGKDGSIMANHSVPDEEARLVIEIARKRDLHILAYREGRLLYEKERPEAEEYGSHLKITGEVIHFDSLSPLNLTKCLIVGDHQTLLPVQEEIRQICGDRINLFFSNPRYLEIVNKEVDKGRAVKEVMTLLDGNTDQAIAMGDGFNDLPMLETAGLGVVMENALPTMKAQFPPERTAGHVDADGVPHYLAELLGWNDFFSEEGNP